MKFTYTSIVEIKSIETNVIAMRSNARGRSTQGFALENCDEYKK